MTVTAAAIADAVVRLGLPVRAAPSSVRSVIRGSFVVGPALPVRHVGSVDVFLEAMTSGVPGGILVVDNEGLTDEACVGDLVALEAVGAGLAGMIVWGCHRDDAELREIGLPVWSVGSLPFGPRGLRPPRHDRLTRATIGGIDVTRDDVAVADDDGVLFVERGRIDEVLAVAAQIAARERAQAAEMRAGRSLRDQLSFDDYLRRRAADPSWTFRRHLDAVRGAIET